MDTGKDYNPTGTDQYLPDNMASSIPGPAEYEAPTPEEKTSKFHRQRSSQSLAKLVSKAANISDEIELTHTVKISADNDVPDIVVPPLSKAWTDVVDEVSEQTESGKKKKKKKKRHIQVEPLQETSFTVPDAESSVLSNPESQTPPSSVPDDAESSAVLSDEGSHTFGTLAPDDASEGGEGAQVQLTHVADVVEAVVDKDEKYGKRLAKKHKKKKKKKNKNVSSDEDVEPEQSVELAAALIVSNESQQDVVSGGIENLACDENDVAPPSYGEVIASDIADRENNDKSDDQKLDASDDLDKLNGNDEDEDDDLDMENGNDGSEDESVKDGISYLRYSNDENKGEEEEDRIDGDDGGGAREDNDDDDDDDDVSMTVKMERWRKIMGNTDRQKDRKDAESGADSDCGFSWICLSCRERGPRETCATGWSQCRGCTQKRIEQAYWTIRGMNKALLATIIVIFLAVLLFVSVFPPSLVYVEYYEVGLLKSKYTGYVDNQVYYPGCYVLGPDKEFKRFQTSATFVELKDISIFTKDGLEMWLTCTFQHFLRPEEVAILHDEFDVYYEPVFRKIAISTIKNTAIQYTLDDYRLKRATVEKEFHQVIKKRLGGTCCPSCCPERCTNNTQSCTSCQYPGNCTQAYHTDVKFFQFGEIYIPPEVSSRFMTRAMLKIEHEIEKFKQDYAVISKETDSLVQMIKNQAKERLTDANASSDRIATIANTDAEVKTQTALKQALKETYTKLNITQEEHKMSLYLIRTLEDMDNLYSFPNYDQRVRYKPSN